MFFIYNIIYNEFSFIIKFFSYLLKKFHMECVHPLVEKDDELVFCLF